VWRFAFSSPRHGQARGSGEKGLGKTHIGELFFKERVLRLPSPWPARIRITITERHLRLLISVIIVLFLVALGSSLLMQLADSRTSTRCRAEPPLRPSRAAGGAAYPK
jgi:hypothetical protein